MNGTKFFEALGNIDDKYIQEALTHDKEKKWTGTIWVKWCAVAAGLFLAVFAGINIVDRNSVELPSEKLDLPMLSTGFEGEGMGYEGYLFYDISERGSANPWNEETKLDTLPVYKNLAYAKGLGGEPIYFSKEGLMALAEEIAGKLGEQIIEADYMSLGKNAEGSGFSGEEVYGLVAVTGSMRIHVEGNGFIRVEPTPCVEIPEQYRISEGNVENKEAAGKKAVGMTNYLLETYAQIFDFNEPIVNVWGDYFFSGERNWQYSVYNGDEDIVQSILNYNFEEVQFSVLRNELLYINMDNLLLCVEKLGDYPIITAKEARKCLLKGEYITTVPAEYLPEGKIREKDIAKVELVYLTGNGYEMYLPYYRFYVGLSENLNVQKAAGLKSFGGFYVPAVRREYLSDYPVEIYFD